MTFLLSKATQFNCWADFTEQRKIEQKLRKGTEATNQMEAKKVSVYPANSYESPSDSPLFPDQKQNIWFTKKVNHKGYKILWILEPDQVPSWVLNTLRPARNVPSFQDLIANEAHRPLREIQLYQLLMSEHFEQH